MEPSKPPKDVLGLGLHLVRELGFEDGVDTLGRWMAHHVAELIKEVENARTTVERAKARKGAAETILKIWAHRASLPDKAYPLSSYKEILKVLELLRPDDNPFKHFGRNPDAKRDELAATLFDRLSRLIIALLLMKVPSRARSRDVGTTATKALSETEHHVLTALQRWDAVFVLASKSSRRAQKNKSSEAKKVNLNEAALGLLDGITSTLSDLRTELQGRPK